MVPENPQIIGVAKRLGPILHGMASIMQKK